MLKSVVAVPGTANPAIPETLCCACGQEFGAGLHGRAADGLKVQWKQYTFLKASAPTYSFPLCEACAKARAAWDRFPLVGMALGFLAGVALVIGALVTGKMDGTLQDFVNAAVGVLVIALLGMGAGWTAGSLAGGFKPRIAWGRKVAGAVSVNYEAHSPGTRVGDYNAFFRFENDVYARVFEQANRRIEAPEPVRALP